MRHRKDYTNSMHAAARHLASRNQSLMKIMANLCKSYKNVNLLGSAWLLALEDKADSKCALYSASPTCTVSTSLLRIDVAAIRK
jgi:hypothetical protein